MDIRRLGAVECAADIVEPRDLDHHMDEPARHGKFGERDAVVTRVVAVEEMESEPRIVGTAALHIDAHFVGVAETEQFDIEGARLG